MSQENVEIARRWQVAMSANFDEAWDAINEFWDPLADYYPVKKFPDAQPRHGLDEIARFAREFWDAYNFLEYEIEEAMGFGDDRVLLCINLRTEGKRGVALEGRMYQCLWLRHGRFFRVEDHLTPRGALHALGLEAETVEAARPQALR